MSAANTPPQNFSMQPRGNSFATASLVCSLVGFCVPFVGGLTGIVFGILGLKRAKETASGAGMATAGIIIGIVTLLAWSAGSYGINLAYHSAKTAIDQVTSIPRDAAKLYVTDLTKGDISAAMNDSSGMPKETVSDQSEFLRPMGALQDMTSDHFNVVNEAWTLTGTATFEKGKKTYSITVTNSGTGSNTAADWKVTAASFH